MHSTQFAKLARCVVKTTGISYMFKIDRSTDGETCLYAYDQYADSTPDFDVMQRLRFDLMKEIAQALELKFKFSPFENSGLPDFSPDLVDTTGFRSSTHEVVLASHSYTRKGSFLLREAMLVYDALCGTVNEREYDKCFLAEMRGKSKGGKALAVAEEKARLQHIKAVKYAEIESWFSSELQKLNDERSARNKAITAKYRSQLDDAKTCLGI